VGVEKEIRLETKARKQCGWSRVIRGKNAQMRFGSHVR